ncbi:MAG: hypothetical protein ABIV94_07380 [Acidimicrobiales bacterium]
MLLGLTTVFAVLVLTLPRTGHVLAGNAALLVLGLFCLTLAAVTGTNRRRRSDPRDTEESKATAGVLAGWVMVIGAAAHIAANFLGA